MTKFQSSPNKLDHHFSLLILEWYYQAGLVRAFGKSQNTVCYRILSRSTSRIYYGPAYRGAGTRSSLQVFSSRTHVCCSYNYLTWARRRSSSLVTTGQSNYIVSLLPQQDLLLIWRYWNYFCSCTVVLYVLLETSRWAPLYFQTLLFMLYHR